MCCQLFDTRYQNGKDWNLWFDVGEYLKYYFALNKHQKRKSILRTIVGHASLTSCISSIALLLLEINCVYRNPLHIASSPQQRNLPIQSLDLPYEMRVHPSQSHLNSAKLQDSRLDPLELPKMATTWTRWSKHFPRH